MAVFKSSSASLNCSRSVFSDLSPKADGQAICSSVSQKNYSSVRLLHASLNHSPHDKSIGPALAAGCTVILKPASETPLTAYAMARLGEEAGVPPGVVNVLTTTNPSGVTNAMLADPRVRKLSFTGSTGVGRTLLAEAAKSVVSCPMELGGNAPFLVFDDADLEAALDGAMVAKMRNAGEACTAANRFYVQSGIHDAFVAGLTARMAAMKVGPGYDPDTQCGPMITTNAVRKIDRLVSEAVAAGARVTTGGKPLSGNGYFYPPTVIENVPTDAAIAGEEIFGPVAPVYRFETELTRTIAPEWKGTRRSVR
ncbi:NAD/NADP-dependent betaine aldehyde dehydrogenase (plasmid) [Shinella zoogloeoides]|nr:NAD/NADP-dependent betaine aldehyde dehydrogenase [Shinella zoogloeoides]